MKHELIKTEDYLLVVSDKEIKYVRPYIGRYHLEQGHYLTDLTVCKLVIAHLPLNNAQPLEGVDLLPPFKEDVYLNKSKIPIAFECEIVDFEVDMGLGEECIEYGQYPKKITNSEGITEWLGKYIFKGLKNKTMSEDKNICRCCQRNIRIDDLRFGVCFECATGLVD